MALSRCDEETPPNSNVTFGQVESTRYVMLLSRDLSPQPEANSPSINQGENLRSDFGFQTTVNHRLIRIVADARQNKQVESELLSADKPLALEGWVSDSPRPILTVQQIEVAAPEAYGATSPSMPLANPVASRASQIKPNYYRWQTCSAVSSPLPPLDVSAKNKRAEVRLCKRVYDWHVEMSRGLLIF
jgi:hypothetical protein